MHSVVRGTGTPKQLGLSGLQLQIPWTGMGCAASSSMRSQAPPQAVPQAMPRGAEQSAVHTDTGATSQQPQTSREALELSVELEQARQQITTLQQRDPARMGCGASSQTAAFASRPNQWAVVHTTTRASTQEEVKDISPIHTDAATSTPQHRQCLVCKNMITPGVKDSVTPGCTLPNWELGDCQAAPTSEHDRELELSTPDSYDYTANPVGTVEHLSCFVFTVKAPNDAHIALHDGLGPAHDARKWEIALGGWNGSKSVIRCGNQQSEVAMYQGRVLESGGTLERGVTLWVRWTPTSCTVGQGGSVGKKVLMSATRPDSLLVKELAVSTAWGAKGHWSFNLKLLREVCCICTLDWGYECRMCDGCNQSWTHLKALENKVSADSMGPELLEEITSTRALVGISLQYRLDLIVVNTLLQTSAGVDRLVSLMRDQGLQAEIQLGSRSIKIVSEDGNLDLSVSNREAARREKEKGLPVRLSRSIIPTHLRMRSVAKAEGLAALVPNGKLKTLNVSNNTILKHLPVDELMQMECLTSIECRGCSRLYCPPPEIVELKGDQVVSYLKSARVEHSGIFNTAVEMIAIGNGEAGKTSIIRALMNGTSEKIHEDKRTVGIDLKTWDLSEEEGLVFHIKDLAGQAVYSLTNQFFLVQRAIYLLVWRVDKGKSSDTESWEKQIADMVLTWMESVQLRVPGASLLLVVTHIDCVSQKELDRQIKFVQELVLSKLQDLGEEDDGEYGVVPLTICNEGRSIPVACLLGQGVQDLRREVIRMAKALPWYREAIPKFIIHFEQEIKAEAAKGSTWLPWARYAEKMGSVTSSSLKPGEELPRHKELRDRAAEDAFWMFRICEHIHAQSGRCSSDALPSYNPLGGPKGKGHVTFDRSMSQFLDAGPRTLNIATNGGLTIVAVVRFTGTPGSYERIIDLHTSGVWNHMMLYRFETRMWVEIKNSQSQILHSGGVEVVQNAWSTVVFRYHASTREYWLTVNDNVYTGIASEALIDRTVSNTWIARAFDNQPYFNGDMAGVFVVDEYLSDGAVSAVTSSIEEGQDIDAALRALSEAQVDSKNLEIATKWLHDKAAIKYFGNASAVEKLTPIDQTVFINTEFIIDILKGLIRHNRSVLLTYFEQSDKFDEQTRKMWLRRIQRLAIYGILHRELIPLLWPGGVTDLSKHFWEWARRPGQEESELWSRDVASSEDDYARVITLLEGCDILHQISKDEFIVPALLADTQKNRLDARAFALSECSVVEAFYFAHVPTGFFERLLIKCRKSYSHMDFTSDSAALYHRGLKAQLFMFHAQGSHGDKPSRSITVLKILTSTRVQMAAIEANLETLYSFFPGMQKLDNEVFGKKEALDWTPQVEPIQVQLIESVPALQVSLTVSKNSYSEGDVGKIQACIAKAFTPEVSLYDIIITEYEHEPKKVGVEVCTADQYDYSANPVGTVEHVSSFLFTVKASNDAHIALHDGLGPAHDTCKWEIALGGWNGSKSVIRCGNQQSEVAMYQGRVLESGGQFWVSWTPTSCTVGQGGSVGKNVLMSATRPDSLLVKELAVATCWGAKGHWSFNLDQYEHEPKKALLIRVDTLQKPPTLETLDAEVKKALPGLNPGLFPVIKDMNAEALNESAGMLTYSDLIKQTIQKIESAKPETDQCLIVETGGDRQLDTSRLRVVLVCMDKYISSSETAVQQFRAAVAARKVIIPIICPGYEIKNYNEWWPSNMSEMKAHALFVDMRNMKASPDELLSKVCNELLPQIYKFLEEWRGEAPDPSAFAAAYDRIPCMKCNDEFVMDVDIFSRSKCEEQLKSWRFQCQTQETQETAARQDQAGRVFEKKVLIETCKHGHKSSVEDILSSNVIYSAVPCPCCVQHGQVPPFCFNRETCLLYFSEDTLEHVREGSVTCPMCEKAGRPSSLRILDVITPEVFLSYNWGKELSTQKIVNPMRLRIEQGAGVVCWFDVGGGMGAGQNHIQEMEEGIRKCTVVVIYISDAYCKSPNCMREFLHATKNSKYLIIVLVPDHGPVSLGGPSSGWTGPGPDDKDYWKHATSCSSCKDPDTGDTFSWATLAAFEPIDLRVKDGEATLTNESRHQEETRLLKKAEEEIVKRIQSRFHRGDHIQNIMQQSYSHWRKAALFDSLKSNINNPEEWKREARALFDAIDLDKDSILRKDELLKAVPHLDAKT